MDVTETEKEFEITAELPGLEEKDVQVNVADNVLTDADAINASLSNGVLRVTIPKTPAAQVKKVEVKAAA